MSGLSIGATIAWQIAVEEAAEAGHSVVEREHVVIGICSLEKARQPGALAEPLDAHQTGRLDREAELIATVLGDCALDPAGIRRALRERLGQQARRERGGTIHRSAACKLSFERAFELARARGNDDAEVGVLHLLAAILDSPGEHLAGALQRLGSRTERLRLRVDAEIGNTVVVAAQESERTGIISGPIGTPRSAPVMPSEPGLEPAHAPVERAVEREAARQALGRDLIAEAQAGRLRPVVGRRDEMLQVIRTLRRQRRSVPVLVGEPGVGKTAVVEGLAQRIADGQEGALTATRIVALTPADLVTGARRPGDGPAGLDALVAEAVADRSAILFLDDLHLLLGTGGASEAASVLLQAVVRGEVVCIGAATAEGYRERTERDPVLARYLQPIEVQEPTPEETREILDARRTELIAHHGVSIEPSALDAAVALTVRLVSDRRLPEKALDALDQACARAQVPALSQFAVEGGTRLEPATVTREEVAAVVAEWIGSTVAGAAAAPGTSLEPLLRERIVGQDEAVRRVAAYLRRAQAGLSDGERPLGVLLFAGPAGVGKTTLATVLAEALFGSAERLIRLDLSEYEEGDLTGPLLRQPASVVFLDAADRAPRRATRALAQAFETGRLVDASGQTADARQALFVLASTLETSDEQPRSELVGAVDEVIPFVPLGPAELAALARRRLDAMHARLLRERRIVLDATDEAVALLAQPAAEGEVGARGLDRAIDRLVRNPLSDLIVSGKLAEHGHAVVRVEDGEIRVAVDLSTM
jgi:ATP-dependent Clp protease ATP-binding subunit ClpC